MKIVSFYYDIDGNTYYSDWANRLSQQCTNFGLDFVFKNEGFGNTWIENTRAKPQFMLKMLNDLNEDILWLDIDSVIVKRPDFTIASDWAAAYKDMNYPFSYLHYIKNNDKNREFLKKWDAIIKKEKRGDHTAFLSIYKTINCTPIPPGYFDYTENSTASKRNFFKNTTN